MTDKSGFGDEDAFVCSDVGKVQSGHVVQTVHLSLTRTPILRFATNI